MKPVILTLDDDPEVLRAIERDLRRRFGEHYRILRADSGDAALAALHQLQLRNDPVALFLVDQRMPRMNGVEFLEQAIKLFPRAKRVLLTAYADTDAAIRAINSVQIDYYLLKPWDPPEEKLYPQLQDLLDDWQAAFRPPFQGIRIVGNRWSPHSHQVKHFLAGNQIPYQWLDIETEAEARVLVERAGVDCLHLPLVLFADGTHLLEPSNAQLADKIGLKTRAEKPFYDLIIVGGGPSGLAAGVYAASEGLRTLMVERVAPGGQAGSSARIENYLGFPAGLSGADLARRAVVQARRFGVEILAPQEVVGLRSEPPYHFIKLNNDTELSCHALLIATGVQYRKLDAPGCDQLTGAGVYYGAAMTEAIACAEEDVYILGGANSAGQAAIYFAKFARSVTILVRGEGLAKSMSQYLITEIEAIPNIKLRVQCGITEVLGTQRLEAITLSDASGQSETVSATSLFIFIGAAPHTERLAGIVERDAHGFILAGPDLLREGKRPLGWKPDRDPYLLETSVPGIFVAGDVRSGSVKRVASGVGEGSIAVQFIHQYLARL